MSDNGIDRYSAFEASVKEAETLLQEQYDEDYSLIDVSNSVLSDALKEQIPLQLRWEEIYNEFKSLQEQIEDETNRMFSLAFKQLNTNSYKQLNYNEAKLYAESDDDYVEYKRLLSRMNVVKAKCYSIVESINSRKYVLKNLVDVLRDSNNDYII